MGRSRGSKESGEEEESRGVCEMRRKVGEGRGSRESEGSIGSEGSRGSEGKGEVGKLEM